MDGLTRAHQRSWVVGVLTLILVLLFGATIGASSAHSGAADPVRDHGHHGSWSGGADQHLLMLHTEGGQVETPDAAGFDLAQLTTVATSPFLVSLFVDLSAGTRPVPAPDRAVLQVWRT